MKRHTAHGYTFIKSLNPWLMILRHPAYSDRDQLWSGAPLRKAKTCVIDKCPMSKGTMAFRPVTNALNRADRICVSCMATLIEHAADKGKRAIIKA